MEDGDTIEVRTSLKGLLSQPASAFRDSSSRGQDPIACNLQCLCEASPQCACCFCRCRHMQLEVGAESAQRKGGMSEESTCSSETCALLYARQALASVLHTNTANGRPSETAVQQCRQVLPGSYSSDAPSHGTALGLWWPAAAQLTDN